jgi:hypothetical protein
VQPKHDASEGGYKLHDTDSARVEMMAEVNRRAAVNKQRAKLGPTPPQKAEIDEDKIPDAAKEADESIEE